MFFKHFNELGLINESTIQFPIFLISVCLVGFLFGRYRKVFNEGTNQAALYLWNLLYQGTDKN
jgi:hypothetical protein